MALINLGSIVADIRGSVGDETYSRNQGGAYVRARSGPSAPPNANQLNITASMTALSQAWSGTLTEANRNTWHEYAEQFPRPNRWGKRVLSNGYTRFVSINFPRYVATGLLTRSVAAAKPPL